MHRLSVRFVATASRFHEPYQLSRMQTAFLVPFFGCGALMDPTRGDFVAGLGDVTATSALRRLLLQIRTTPEGRQLIETKPIICDEVLALARLRALSPETFGYQYTQFMDRHNFSADERASVKFMVDTDAAYGKRDCDKTYCMYSADDSIMPSNFLC
jgi:ubiquinone biosynthesis protein COQ4